MLPLDDDVWLGHASESNGLLEKFENYQYLALDHTYITPPFPVA